MPFLLIIAGASKQHKRMPQKVFHANIKALGYFLAWFVCVLLGIFREFPVDPYYEPLAWFMITQSIKYLCAHTLHDKIIKIINILLRQQRSIKLSSMTI